MNHVKAILIDLDGTLANSLPLLYQAYLDFMQYLGLEGSLEEFQELNGPSLNEIVSYLCQKYCIDEPYERLNRKYQEIIKEHYGTDLQLHSGALAFLSFAKKQSWKLAIVSSANSELIENFLKYHGLGDDFDLIVAAENVENGKPAPDIYLKALALLNIHAEEALVIEDSLNGVHSALAAGIPTIMITHGKNTAVPEDALPFIDWNEILNFVKQTFIHYHLHPIPPDFIVKVVPQENEKVLPQKIQTRIDQIWKEESEKSHRLLFDGQVFCLKSLEKDRLEGFFASYKNYLAQLLDEDVKKSSVLSPVCVSGCTQVLDHLLIGKRSKAVTQYPNHYELVPSGGIDPESFFNGYINLDQQFKIELYEEAGIPSASIHEIIPFGLVYDSSLDIYEVCSRIILKPHALEIKFHPNIEYSEIFWISIDQINSFVKKHHSNFVPLSLYLIQIFNKKSL